jgi:hypothetical protein
MLRARMIGVHLMLSSPCLNGIGSGSHEIGAILSQRIVRRDALKMIAGKT